MLNLRKRLLRALIGLCLIVSAGVTAHAQQYSVKFSATSTPQQTVFTTQVLNSTGKTPPILSALDLASLKWKIADSTLGELDATPFLLAIIATPIVNVTLSPKSDILTITIHTNTPQFNFPLNKFAHYWGGKLLPAYGGTKGSNATLLRNAINYPATTNINYTYGMSAGSSWWTIGNPQAFAVSAMPYNTTKTTVISEFRGVGGDGLSKPWWSQYTWWVNILEISLVIEG